jgi:hypothetical protein
VSEVGLSISRIFTKIRSFKVGTSADAAKHGFSSPLVGDFQVTLKAIRGVFDEEVRRKPLAFAAGAGYAAGYGI